MNIKASFQKFNLERLFPIVTMGLVVGAIEVPVVIALAVLIYSGDLAPSLGAGIGTMLFGALVLNIVIALTSSIAGMVGGPQDSPAAILALVALSVSVRLATAPPAQRFATVVAAIMLTSLVSGLFFILIGGFKLSRFIRFIPYPVVGGFIAGTGLLLAQGALGVMTDASIGLASLGQLFQPDVLVRWIPGLVFALLLLFATRRFNHFLVAPTMLLGTGLLFYGFLWATHSSMDSVRAAGWLLGPFPQGALWTPLDFTVLAGVDWSLIASQLSNIGTAAILGSIALLLNASALELIARRDIDLNRELISAGFGNLLAGLGGSSVGYQYLGLSALPLRMGINSRLVGLFAALVSAVVMLFGATLLSLIPKFIVGGLLLFLGLSFLVEWVYDAWRQLPHLDYALVLVILVVVGAAGFLPGVAVGTVIAVILFVVNYSRINLVKDTLSGVSYKSNMERPAEHRQLLQSRGEQIHILRLQGFIFFGTAQNLLNRIRERIDSADLGKLSYLVLDFQHVSALDSSAVFSFVRMKQLAETHRIRLVFTAVSPEIRAELEKGGLVDGKDDLFDIFPELDYGMEWCEDRLLMAANMSMIIKSKSFQFQLNKILHSPDLVERFMKYLEKVEVGADTVLIHQGEVADSMYFVESGLVTAKLEVEPGEFIRLKSMGPGTVVGEIGLYLHNARTATVVASQPTVLYRLSAEALKEMETKDPDLASHLHRWIIMLMGERLADNNRTLEALLN